MRAARAGCSAANSADSGAAQPTMPPWATIISIVAALKAGAYDYLTKPVDLKQFRAVVAAAPEGDD